MHSYKNYNNQLNTLHRHTIKRPLSVITDPAFRVPLAQYNAAMLPNSFSQIKWVSKITLDTLFVPFFQSFLFTSIKVILGWWKRGGLVGVYRRNFGKKN